MTAPVHLYHLAFPLRARWFAGDQIPRAAVRTLLKPFRRVGFSGLGKVVENLVLGLERLNIPYRVHRQPVRVEPGARAVGILHGPIDRCSEVASRYRSLIGPGVMTTPHDWPGVFEETKVAAIVQACEWSADMYRSMFGNRVLVWPTGIDTHTWAPRANDPKTRDFLIYDKVRWQGTVYDRMVDRAKDELTRRGLSFHYIRYGHYAPADFERMLRDSRAMLFLCEHESQGIAYNEALSVGVPILAANFGHWCDPNQSKYDFGPIQVTSIPYWDERCGMEFRGQDEFSAKLDEFHDALAAGRFVPRDYILENLTLEKCARNYVRLLDEA